MPSLTLKFGLSMGGRGATLRTHDANAVAVILFGFLADRIGSKQAIVIDLDLHEVRSRLEGLSFFVAFVGSAAPLALIGGHLKIDVRTFHAPTKALQQLLPVLDTCCRPFAASCEVRARQHVTAIARVRWTTPE